MFIRDSNSKIFAAAVKTSQLWKDMAYVEAEAMKGGLKVVKEVADLVNNKKGSKAEIYWVISEI